MCVELAGADRQAATESAEAHPDPQISLMFARQDEAVGKHRHGQKKFTAASDFGQGQARMTVLSGSLPEVAYRPLPQRCDC
jgi:hypothetical protein